MRHPVSLILLGLLATAEPSIAQERAWLPARVETAAAQQLADRLLALGEAEGDERELVEGARALIAGMRDTVEAWGAAGAEAKAPAFAAFELPGAGQPQLDAMGHWTICNLVEMLQVESPALAGRGDARLLATLGLSAITLVILRLREPFVAGGGTQAQIEAHLTSSAFEPVFESIQTEPELLAHAAERCEPAVRELLAAPVEYLRSRNRAGG